MSGKVRPGRWAGPGLLAALLCVPPALAQSTGALKGLVTDAGGAPLPGAVIAVSSASQAVAGRGAVTDGSGAFLVPSLPAAGDYVVRASLPGYAAVSLSDVEVRPGATAGLRIGLQRETDLRQRIEVRARPQVVNVEDTSTATQFDAEFIQTLPLLGRNYQDLLALAPGVTDIDGDGNPNIHGARDTDVATLVDGVATTDPLTGKVGAQLNIDSIQEVEVKTSGASAESGRAQGGFVNVITRSGGNDFRGSFKIFWRGSLLDGDGAGSDDPRLHAGIGESGLRDLRFNDLLPFLSLEGPLARDHAWFFISSESIRTEDPVNALSSAFIRGVREMRQFAKMTWQLTPTQRASLWLNDDPQEFLNQGLNSFTRPESGYTTREGGLVLTLKATSVLSPLTALETSLSTFDARPSRMPTIGPDTNHNGILSFDRNHDGLMQLSERDPGEDYDNDGVFDVFEDKNHNGNLDVLEDVDRDFLLTPAGACEGVLREDQNCNGILEPDEDRNHNGILDDTPTPTSLYPYGELRPVPQDRDYSIDQKTKVISGPYYQDSSDRRQRATLRQDLSLYIPDRRGSHDLRIGYVFEREKFARDIEMRPVTAPYIRPRRTRDPLPPSNIHALLPAEPASENHATGSSAGTYVQDIWKPLPNLSVGLGMRFDREVIDTLGYTFFDPAPQRALFDQLDILAGGEVGKDDFLEGNNDGLRNLGITGDPIFADAPDRRADYTKGLLDAALSRLSRPHEDTKFASDLIASLFPGVVGGGLVDPAVLTANGFLPSQKQPFALTNNNLAPRLSLSFDPASDGRTKLFATWGRYYDRLFLNTVTGEQGPDRLNAYYLLDEDGVDPAGIPDHQVGQYLSKSPPSITQVDRGLETPFSDELTLGFQREVAPEVAVGLTYINRRFRRQLQDIDVNHAIRIDPTTGQPFDLFGQLTPRSLHDEGFAELNRSPDGRPDLYIENFFFNEILRIGNDNEARYHALELTVLRRLWRRWELQGSYTYSRAVGSAEDFQSRLGNDPSTLESEFGYLDYDQRHVVKLNGLVYVPHDWQLGFTASWSSGLPYSIVSRFFALDNVGYVQFRTRFGTTVAGPQGFQFETLRRNSFRNAAVYDFNVRAQKSIVVGRMSGSLFLEVFNLLNTDDLRILSYEPSAATRLDTADPFTTSRLQIDGERRFGRRFQVGLQLNF